MLNQTVLVGRLVKEPELYQTENGNKVTNITLAVPRAYKNVDGEYDTDFISCTLWRGIAENTVQYCHKGDLLGIKGHICSKIVDLDENTRRQTIELVAEKITYLSSKRKDD